MATALNLTLKLKQDPVTQATLKGIKEVFSTKIQPAIDKALRENGGVHFARVLVINDEYIQVLTEFDGDKQLYTTFFLEALPEVFQTIFSLVEDVPPWDELKDPDRFYEVASGKNVRSLGSRDDDPNAGYLFQAFGNTTVAEIKKGLDRT